MSTTKHSNLCFGAHTQKIADAFGVDIAGLEDLLFDAVEYKSSLKLSAANITGVINSDTADRIFEFDTPIGTYIIPSSITVDVTMVKGQALKNVDPTLFTEPHVTSEISFKRGTIGQDDRLNRGTVQKAIQIINYLGKRSYESQFNDKHNPDSIRYRGSFLETSKTCTLGTSDNVICKDPLYVSGAIGASGSIKAGPLAISTYIRNTEKVSYPLFRCQNSNVLDTDQLILGSGKMEIRVRKSLLKPAMLSVAKHSTNKVEDGVRHTIVSVNYLQRTIKSLTLQHQLEDVLRKMLYTFPFSRVFANTTDIPIGATQVHVDQAITYQNKAENVKLMGITTDFKSNKDQPFWRATSEIAKIDFPQFGYLYNQTTTDLETRTTNHKRLYENIKTLFPNPRERLHENEFENADIYPFPCGVRAPNTMGTSPHAYTPFKGKQFIVNHNIIISAYKRTCVFYLFSL